MLERSSRYHHGMRWLWVPAFAGTTRRETPATFCDGDINPRASKLSYVRRVLFVRGASRGRSLSGTGCGACTRGSQLRRPGGWGHRPGQLCGSAVRGWTRCGMKAAKAGQGSISSPVLTRKYGPLAQNRRNGAPQGDALPENAASPAVPAAKQDKVRFSALHAPRVLRGEAKRRNSRAARERSRASFVGANGAGPTRACCLKIESKEGARVTA